MLAHPQNATDRKNICLGLAIPVHRDVFDLSDVLLVIVINFEANDLGAEVAAFRNRGEKL